MTNEDNRREYLFNLLSQNPSGIERFEPADLRIVLSSFLHIGRVLNPLAQSLMNIESKEHQLSAESSSRKKCAFKLFLSCLVLLAIILIGYFYNQSRGIYRENPGPFLTCIFLAFIVDFLVFLIYGIYALIMHCTSKQKSKHLRSDYESLNAQLTKELNTYVKYMRVGQKVLPSYYFDDGAMAIMVEYLDNHRATNIADVLNLYERELWQLRVSGRLQENIAQIQAFMNKKSIQFGILI